jgi:DNA-binding NarL/FixJ family response regulator
LAKAGGGGLNRMTASTGKCMAIDRIIIADDHPLFRDALKQILIRDMPHAILVEAGDLEEVTAAMEEAGDTDLILLDLKMPGVQGFSGLIYLRAQYPGVPVAVISASEEPAIIRRAISLGASGFIPKSASAEQMQQAVRAVLDGELAVPEDVSLEVDGEDEAGDTARLLSTLTPQQMRVLMMLREGLLNKQIAWKLGVSEATIKAHVSAILQKLKVESRTQAVIAASRVDGELITPDRM